jgi:DNA invertase Pin-like site-specific DNA recombinase
MPVYVYFRGTDTLPLEAQQRRIAEEVMRNGSTVDMTVIEHNPRSIPLHKRREGKRLLRRLQPGDIVVAAAFTCIFASPFEIRKIICDFRQRQISLRLLDLGDITDDKTSKMFLAMLSAFGDLKTVRGGRIRAGKAKLRAVGKYQGGKRPFGWQVGWIAPWSQIQSNKPPWYECASFAQRANRCARPSPRCRTPASPFPSPPCTGS